MTNSRPFDLSSLIECLRQDTDDAALAAHIDEPVDAAVSDIASDNSGEFSIAAFHAALSGLVQRIYEQALPVSRRLSGEQALASGIDWLDKFYISRETRGYSVAVLDAMEEPWDGICVVCEALAESMKQEFRRQRVTGELVRLLAPFDWIGRVQLVRDCLTRFELLLPEQLRSLPPEQLVDELPELILLVSTIDQPILQETAT